MSHDLWWSDELVKNVASEIFVPISFPSPRKEIMLSQDPLDILKSDEYVLSKYSNDPESSSNHESALVFNFDFADPASAAECASNVLLTIQKDRQIRADESSTRKIIGRFLIILMISHSFTKRQTGSCLKIVEQRGKPGSAIDLMWNEARDVGVRILLAVSDAHGHNSAMVALAPRMLDALAHVVTLQVHPVPRIFDAA